MKREKDKKILFKFLPGVCFVGECIRVCTDETGETFAILYPSSDDII